MYRSISKIKSNIDGVSQRSPNYCYHSASEQLNLQKTQINSDMNESLKRFQQIQQLKSPNFESKNLIQNSRNSFKNNREKIMSLDENVERTCNTEPTLSFENSSSRSLIDLLLKKEDNMSENNKFQSEIKDKPLQKYNSLKLNGKLSKSIPSLNDKLKPSLNRQKSRESWESQSQSSIAAKSKRRKKSKISCYILQQYFIYLIIWAVIICGSFGFYYVIVSMNLKMELLEKRINEKIISRLPIRLIPSKDYYEKDELSDSNYNSEDYPNLESKMGPTSIKTRPKRNTFILNLENSSDEQQVKDDYSYLEDTIDKPDIFTRKN